MTESRSDRAKMLQRMVVVVLVSIACLPSLLCAEEAQDPSVDEARQHFMRGVELYQNNEHEAALAEFLRANTLAPHYRLLYNIGLVQARLLTYPAAVDALEEYLEEGGDEVPARRQNEVRQLLRRFRRHVGRIRIDVVGPESALVYVDEAEVGRSPLDEPIAVTTGRRLVEVRAEGFLPYRRSVIVAGGVEAQLRAELIHVETQMGAVLLNVAVLEAMVTLDGEEVGTSPLEGPIVASPGRHVIEVSRPGYETEGRTAEVTVGEVTSLDISLRSLESIPDDLAGGLEVDLSEDDAEVLVDGAPFEGGQVPIGRHVVEVRLEGFQPWWGEVDVEQGEVAVVNTTLRPTEGFLERYRRRARIIYTTGAITLFLGVAVLAADLGLFVWNIGRQEQWVAEDDDLQENVGSIPPEEWRQRWDDNEELNQSLKQWNVALWAMFGAGIALTGAAIAIIATAPRPRRYLNLAFAPTPGGFAFGLRISHF